jgi:hypothetical protein
MKKMLTGITITLSFVTIVNAGSLAVSCVPVMGDRSHSHAMAIWIENSSGQFVKTLTRIGNVFYTELTTWMNKSGGNTTDALTCATIAVYDTTISGAWNLTNLSGNRVPNGDYWYCVEMANWGNAAILVKTKISIDGISKTKTTVDSAQNNAATYITNVQGVYTDQQTKIIHPIHESKSVKSIRLGEMADKKRAVSINGQVLQSPKANAESKSHHIIK